MSILDEAQKLTSKDRQDVYGHPIYAFKNIAHMSEPINNSDIDPALKHALTMIQVKIARLLTTPDHIDSIVGIAGYANTYAMVLERLNNENKGTREQELRSSDS